MQAKLNQGFETSVDLGLEMLANPDTPPYVKIQVMSLFAKLRDRSEEGGDSDLYKRFERLAAEVRKVPPAS